MSTTYTYTYSLANDFLATTNVVLDQLQAYLYTIFTTKSFYVNLDGDVVSVVFTTQLSGSENTTLNNAIASYTNVYQSIITNQSVTNGTYSDPIIILSDRKSVGTNGGVPLLSTWITRDLNYKEGFGTYVTLGTNTFTLPQGRYQLQISCPAASVGTHQCGLWSVTASQFVATGTSSIGNSNTTIDTIISVNVNTTFSIRHWLTSGGLLVTPYLGLANGSTLSLNETYTVVKISKIS